MITSSPVPEHGGWNPIPHDTARDRRLDRRARGLLFEILSYPPGWHINADKLAEMGDEGRDAIRKAMRQLEEAGYLIHLRYRGDGGKWLTASFAGNTPEVAKHLANTWADEHADRSVSQKPSSHRGTGYQASVNQASADQSSVNAASENQALRTKRPTTKTEGKKKSEDEEGSRAAAASQRACLAADGKPPAKNSGEAAATADPIKHELSSYLRRVNDLSDETIDAALADWEESRSGMYAWALKMASKQSGIAVDEAGGDDWLRLRRLTFKWALKCSASDGAWHDDLLNAFAQVAA